MKSRVVAFALTAVAILVASLMACDKSSVGPGQADPVKIQAALVQAIRERTRSAAQLHNRYMQLIHERLKAERAASGKLTRASTHRVVKQACLEFVAQHRANPALCNDADRILIPKSISRELVASSPTASLSTGSAPYDPYLADIENAANIAVDRDHYISILGTIEAAAVSDPAMYSDTLDLELVFAVSSTAAESAYYADTEVESWGELYDPCHEQIIRGPECPPLYKPSLDRKSGWQSGALNVNDLERWGRAGWSILIADVGGALGGGIVARLGRLIIPHAAVLGAGIASGTAAATEIVNWFYDD